jgi:hypothetical protein
LEALCLSYGDTVTVIANGSRRRRWELHPKDKPMPDDNAVKTHISTDRVIDFDITDDPALRFDVFKRLDEVRNAAPRVTHSSKSGGINHGVSHIDAGTLLFSQPKIVLIL